MSTIENKLKIIAGLISGKLHEALSKRDPDYDKLLEAMDYSTSAGGKRIRPFLVISVSDIFGGNSNEAILYATALEMIHTYSLIHDDLPCMDNDDLRRGKPTCHKVFGEATAMLAGDALLTYAFEILATNSEIPADHRIKAVAILSKYSGVSGMIGGQQMDLSGEGQSISYETMTKMHSLKTGALIKAACELGALSASVDDEKTLADLDCYAEGIGRVFQLVDDLLDESATVEELGKPIHSDVKNQKTTYLTFMPAEIAKGLADVITEKAVEAIAPYDKKGILTEFAKYLQNRSK
ncbi:MAG: polyprenyl synthetase family protein [Eubacteriales bacterium]